MTARLCRRNETGQQIPKASPQIGTANPHDSLSTSGVPQLEACLEMQGFVIFFFSKSSTGGSSLLQRLFLHLPVTEDTAPARSSLVTWIQRTSSLHVPSLCVHQQVIYFSCNGLLVSAGEKAANHLGWPPGVHCVFPLFFFLEKSPHVGSCSFASHWTQAENPSLLVTFG